VSGVLGENGARGIIGTGPYRRRVSYWTFVLVSGRYDKVWQIFGKRNARDYDCNPENVLELESTDGVWKYI
jgi:hypothetical protein